MRGTVDVRHRSIISTILEHIFYFVKHESQISQGNHKKGNLSLRSGIYAAEAISLTAKGGDCFTDRAGANASQSLLAVTRTGFVIASDICEAISFPGIGRDCFTDRAGAAPLRVQQGCASQSLLAVTQTGMSLRAIFAKQSPGRVGDRHAAQKILGVSR